MNNETIFVVIFIIVCVHIFTSGNKAMFGLFNPAGKAASIFVFDTAIGDQMPNLGPMYNAERNSKYVEKKIELKIFNFD